MTDMKEIAENYEKLHRLAMINMILKTTSDYIRDVISRVEDEFNDCEEFDDYVTESVIKHVKESIKVLQSYVD